MIEQVIGRLYILHGSKDLKYDGAPESVPAFKDFKLTTWYRLSMNGASKAEV